MSTISSSTTSTTAYKVTADTTGTLVIQTGATPTTAVTVDASQNVGIGTSSPAYKLDILTGGGGVYAAQFGNGTAAQGMRIVTGMDSTSSGITTGGGTRLIQFDGTSNVTQFYTNASERMRIDSSGNVGIGVTPSYRLEVKGPSATAGQLSIHDGTGDITVSGNNAASLLFQARDTSVRTIAEIDAVNTTTNGTGGAMVFQTRISDTLAERMRIDSSGNLLFNSGYGSVATAYGCRAWVNFNGTGAVAIRASANVTSITDNGVGDYTVNFTNAMPDVNYSIVGSSGSGNTYGSYAFNNPGAGSRFAVGSCRINSFITQSAGLADVDTVCVSVFR